MKQIERRFNNEIAIECELTLKEKLNVLFSKMFVLKVDLSVDSSDGVVNSQRNLLTLN